MNKNMELVTIPINIKFDIKFIGNFDNVTYDKYDVMADKEKIGNNLYHSIDLRKIALYLFMTKPLNGTENKTIESILSEKLKELCGALSGEFSDYQISISVPAASNKVAINKTKNPHNQSPFIPDPIDVKIDVENITVKRIVGKTDLDITKNPYYDAPYYDAPSDDSTSNNTQMSISDIESILLNEITQNEGFN